MLPAYFYIKHKVIAQNNETPPKKKKPTQDILKFYLMLKKIITLKT